jgi:hypothetical protein
MSRLARDFGISDVALAKICKKLDVPIPGRGYWARVAAGQRVRVPKLPKARADARTEFTIAEREPRPKVEKLDVPIVTMAESLTGAHPAVRRLSSLLDGREPGREKTLYLRGDSEATIRLTSGTKRRALLVLDAVLKALDQRGHAVTFEVPNDAWSPHSLQIKVGAEVIKLFLAEPSTRTDHKLTVQEQADRTRYGSTYAPKYDFNTSGKLTLRARVTPLVGRVAAAARGHPRRSRDWGRRCRGSHGCSPSGAPRELATSGCRAAARRDRPRTRALRGCSGRRARRSRRGPSPRRRYSGVGAVGRHCARAGRQGGRGAAVARLGERLG